MKKCVTIDMDYWTSCFQTFRPWAIPFIEKMAKKAKTVRLIDEHHEILPFIDDNFDEVTNIDFHNDIIGVSGFEGAKKDDCLNEGTWGNFLPSVVKKFTWIYPSKKECIEIGDGLCRGQYDEVFTDYPINYQQIRDCRQFKPKRIDLLVICKSVGWDTTYTLDKYWKHVEKLA